MQFDPRELGFVELSGCGIGQEDVATGGDHAGAGHRHVGAVQLLRDPAPGPGGEVVGEVSRLEYVPHLRPLLREQGSERIGALHVENNRLGFPGCLAI